MKYSAYFQAIVVPETSWFVAGALRSYEHLAFDRTLMPERSLYEFFVSPDLVDEFLGLMRVFEQQGLIANLQQFPNRLITQAVHPR